MRPAKPLLVALALTAFGAQAQTGLRVNLADDDDPAWQARLHVLAGSPDSGSRLLGAQLLGDYYLVGRGNGLRVSGGLLLGPSSLMAPGLLPSQSGRFGLGLRQLSGNTDEALQNQPYLGLGYSHSGGDWRFSADLGVAMAGSLRLGGSQSAFNSSFDDTLRRLQLTPLLQLGVSYRF
jgi:hypothetical protein